MKYCHSIKITVFSYEDEDYAKVHDSLLKLFLFSLEENKIQLKKTSAEGFSDRKIVILEVMLSKEKLVNAFLKNFLEKLTKQQKEVLIEQAESRLDENLDFFVRIDKNYWIEFSKMELTDSGKCLHIRMSIATFPKKRENALKVVKELFGCEF